VIRESWWDHSLQWVTNLKRTLETEQSTVSIFVIKWDRQNRHEIRNHFYVKKKIVSLLWTWAVPTARTANWFRTDKKDGRFEITKYMKRLRDSLSTQSKEIQSLSELRVISTTAGQPTMYSHHYLSESVTKCRDCGIKTRDHEISKSRTSKLMNLEKLLYLFSLYRRRWKCSMVWATSSGLWLVESCFR